MNHFNNMMKSVKNAVQSLDAGATNKTLGNIRVGHRDIKEDCLLSEGGYAYIYKVRDAMTGEIFALKKMICQNSERLATAKNEISILKSLPDHPNLMKYYDSQIVQTNDGHIAYILIEFCAEGSLFDLMTKYESTKLSEKQIVFIMKEVCEGIKVLHSKKPPITHRDLKIENVLLSNKKFKLCDFGSCSTDYIDLSKTERTAFGRLEETFEKNTTLMYRPPEMCDLYMKYTICEKVDVWMLGCILFTVCFYRHPFMECSKLAIVNAAFTLPSEPVYSEKLRDLMRLMLTPDPKYRPSIFDMCDLFGKYDSLTTIQLSPQALEIKNREQVQQKELEKYANNAKKIRKFDGDIPIHELQKLQLAVKKQQSEGEKQNGLKDWDDVNIAGATANKRMNSNPGSNQGNTTNFDNFNFGGNGGKKVSAFNSSPPTNNKNDWSDWGDFQTSNFNSSHSNKSRGEEQFHSNPSNGGKDMFAQQFNSTGSAGKSNNNNNNGNNSFNPFEAFGFNTGGSNGSNSNSNSNSQQKPADPKIQQKWDNFDFSNDNKVGGWTAASNGNHWGAPTSQIIAPLPQPKNSSNTSSPFNTSPFNSNSNSTPPTLANPQISNNNNANVSAFGNFNSNSGPSNNVVPAKPIIQENLLDLAAGPVKQPNLLDLQF
jgi:AP2-associated kinase